MTGPLVVQAGPHPAAGEAARTIYLPVVLHGYHPFYAAYGKKGIGDAWQNWAAGAGGVNLEALDYGWYYDWTYSFLPQRSDDPKYVRMVWCSETSQKDLNGVSHTITEIARSDAAAGRRGRVWLVFNEPDDTDPDPANQPCGDVYFGDPAGAARRFMAVAKMIKEGDPSARVFAGGLLWIGSPETRSWWASFVGGLRSAGALARLEGIHVHLYPYLSTSPVREASGGCGSEDCVADVARVAAEWYAFQDVLGLGNRPMWISETGWLACDGRSQAWIRDNFMIPLSRWFDRQSPWPYAAPENPGYDAIAWFATRDPGWFPCTHLLDGARPNGGASALGAYWNSFQPQ